MCIGLGDFFSKGKANVTSPFFATIFPGEISHSLLVSKELGTPCHPYYSHTTPNLESHGLYGIIWVVVSNIFYFHPYLGKIPILANIFQRGWNHQLVNGMGPADMGNVCHYLGFV